MTLRMIEMKCYFIHLFIYLYTMILMNDWNEMLFYSFIYLFMYNDINEWLKRRFFILVKLFIYGIIHLQWH
jgi:hypothetical protein